MADLTANNTLQVKRKEDEKQRMMMMMMIVMANEPPKEKTEVEEPEWQRRQGTSDIERQVVFKDKSSVTKTAEATEQNTLSGLYSSNGPK